MTPDKQAEILADWRDDLATGRAFLGRAHDLPRRSTRPAKPAFKRLRPIALACVECGHLFHLPSKGLAPRLCRSCAPAAAYDGRDGGDLLDA